MPHSEIDWPSVFDRTLEICQEDPAYAAYSIREKMLSFIFTFLQNMNEEPEKYAAVLKQRIPLIEPKLFPELRNLFFDYTGTMILEGTNSGEIQARPLIANYYRNVLWNAFLSILFFWAYDRSDHKEKTDVVVEKTTHFAFDLLAPNAIDSGIDLLQNLFKLRNR